MKTARQETSQKLEKIFGISLEKALKLTEERVGALQDRLDRVVDDTRVDRMVLEYVDGHDLEPSDLPIGLSPTAFNYEMVALGKRLGEALVKIQRLGADDTRRGWASSIVAAARAEGRIQENPAGQEVIV